MKKSIWIRLTALCAVLSLLASGAMAADSLPWDCYNYDYWDNILYTPAPYVPDGSVSGASLQWQGAPLGSLNNPQDLCVSDSGDIYIADTNNDRVIVVANDLKTVRKIITGFTRDGVEETFSRPSGVAVSEKNQIYIADSQNRRIVVLEEDGTFVKTVQDPKSEVLDEGYVFVPLKVSVDYADRVYCVAQNMFQGIMVFAAEGDFTGFFGTISVKISMWEKFWRRFSTKESRAKQQLFIPTEFTGIDVDDEGFVYASNKDTDGLQAVRRLNPSGQDVIKKGPHENLGGDRVFGQVGNYSGPSQIVDVVYRGHGIYSLLDSRRGRIFTYDHEGNLLYIFGGIGTQEGTFRTPTAIEQLGSRLLVLDSNQAAVLIFSQTEYGRLINEAVSLRYDGDESQAVQLWQEVLRLDENNELANSGIGKAYLSAGDNEKAMTYLRRGMNRSYYSTAYKRYRNEVLAGNLSIILTAVIALIALWVIVRKVILPRRQKKGGKTA